MAKFYLSCLIPLLVLLLCKPDPVISQPTCTSPLVLIQDNLDSYTTGALGPQAAHWTTWSGTEGGAEDGVVSDDLGNNALYIEGQTGGGPQDVLLLLGNKSAGAYLLEWSMYVPSGSGAYYNIQHFETPGMEWAFELHFETNGTGNLDAGTADLATFVFPNDAFFKVRHVIDVDHDRIYLFVNGRFVHSWPFSWQATSASGTKQLGAVDFFPRDQNDAFYVDNIVYNEIPSPESGQYCHLATSVDVGTHSVDAITCFGAGFTVRSAGQGNAGEWFSWTAPSDGILTVSSCEGGSDTRFWVFSGGCENLNIEGVNDDRCLVDSGGTDAYASYREVLVTGGETYLIVFDDIWEGNAPFDFSISFSTDAPAEGDFCQTAIPVTPGTHTIDQINGDAAVSGPNINHTTASTTSYAQSEWYAFTPEMDGKMGVFTCGLTDEDTRLWIYTGTCGIESLELIASNDDTCGLQSLIEELPVTANTTYYIEWDSEDADAPGFDWVLDYQADPSGTAAAWTSGLSIYPNPARNVAFVDYHFAAPADLLVRLYDNQGQFLHSYEKAGMMAGRQPLDLSEYPAGLYFVVVSNGEQQVSRKLVVE